MLRTPVSLHVCGIVRAQPRVYVHIISKHASLHKHSQQPVHLWAMFVTFENFNAALWNACWPVACNQFDMGLASPASNGASPETDLICVDAQVQPFPNWMCAHGSNIIRHSSLCICYLDKIHLLKGNILLALSCWATQKPSLFSSIYCCSLLLGLLINTYCNYFFCQNKQNMNSI